jgi:oligopeptide/dipeptide ABC transporter ATP-binding protein
LVKIAEAQKRVANFPHQFSGGQRQRVMIAMALACTPKLLIADEPTTALDVTIQAEVLQLFRDLQKETGLALLLVTHDLGVVSQMADRALDMYAGRKVEEGPAKSVLRRPAHPYTRLLLAARPRRSGSSAERLADIPGIVPPLNALPPGCAFAPRCPQRIKACLDARPPLVPVNAHQVAACVRADGS